MRISVIKGDPDFVSDPRNYTVLIDGVIQTHCITADTEKGVALRYKKTALGTLCKGRNNKFVTEEVRGVIVIERKPYLSEEYKAELRKLKINDHMYGKFDTELS